ncbi:MAG: hypothetical protein RLZZ303_2682 [Candidatus Hydrogenedentota bacterium]
MSAAQPSGGRILLATETAFWRRDTGAAQRIASLCAFVEQRGFQLVVFFPDRVRRADRDAFHALLPKSRLATPSFISLATRALKRRAGALLRRDGLGPASLPVVLRRPWIREKQRAFRRLCVQSRPDAVIIAYLQMTFLLEGEKLSAWPMLKILDAIDVQSERALRDPESRGVPAIQPDDEASALRRYDVVLAIQNREAAILKELAPHARVVTVGHALPITPLPPRRRGSPTALFFAGPARHNIVALEQLSREIWPRILNKLPNSRLIIAGGICDAYTEALPPGVSRVGRVLHPAEAYAQADLLLNPVCFGSGLKVKNVEALAFGMPLLTTPVGAEGLEPGVGSAFLCEEEPAAFAEAAVQLLSDPERRRVLSAAALDYARAHFSEEAAYGALLDILRGACYRES